jgi:hypothetical protein
MEGKETVPYRQPDTEVRLLLYRRALESRASSEIGERDQLINLSITLAGISFARGVSPRPSLPRPGEEAADRDHARRPAT